MSKEHPHSHELYTEPFDDLLSGVVKFLLIETEVDVAEGDEIEVFELDREGEGRTGRAATFEVTSVTVGNFSEGIEAGWLLLSVERRVEVDGKKP